jgi:hypothetical protein
VRPVRKGSPSTAELQEVLRTGRLPVNSTTLRKLRVGLAAIGSDHTAWAVAEQQLSDRELALKFARLAQLADEFAQLLADDPQRQIEAILTVERWGRAPVDLDWLREAHEQRIKSTLAAGGWGQRAVDLAWLRETLDTASAMAAHYAKVYADGSRRRASRTEPENWLFRQLYGLAAKIKGSQPGLAAPFYRYVVGCSKLLGVDLRHLREATFIKRVSALRREGELKIWRYRAPR